VNRVEPEHIPCLFDTDQSLPRVIGIWCVRNIWEDLLDEFRSLLCESGIGIGNVEDVWALELRFDRQAESLCTVSGVNVTETANRQRVSNV